jgi:hypothetical protein
MTTLTVSIDNDKDLPVLKEILNRFGMDYTVNKTGALNNQEHKLLKDLKKSFTEINEWEAGKTRLQSAKEAIKEIEAELNNGV